MTDETEGSTTPEPPAERTASEPPTATDETTYSTATAMERFEASLPDCPTCGRTVWVVSIDGSLETIASPCGCTVDPSQLERE